MPRCARLVIPGIPHHITQRGNRRENVFFDDEDRYFFLRRLRYYADKAELGIASYCLMTNHIHSEVIPKNEDSIHRTFKPLLMNYSQYLNKRFQRTGLNWQGRFFSSPLDELHAWHTVRYIILNPVRAGIVKNAQEYEWSSAKAHLNLRADPNLTAESYWLELAKKACTNLKELENENDQFDFIRKNTLANLPVGSNSFIESLEEKFNRVLVAQNPGRPRKIG